MTQSQLVGQQVGRIISHFSKLSNPTPVGRLLSCQVRLVGCQVGRLVSWEVGRSKGWQACKLVGCFGSFKNCSTLLKLVGWYDGRLVGWQVSRLVGWYACRWVGSLEARCAVSIHSLVSNHHSVFSTDLCYSSPLQEQGTKKRPKNKNFRIFFSFQCFSSLS